MARLAVEALKKQVLLEIPLLSLLTGRRAHPYEEVAYEVYKLEPF